METKQATLEQNTLGLVTLHSKHHEVFEYALSVMYEFPDDSR